MSTEKATSTIKASPTKWATNEDVNNSKSSINLSNKYIKVNNVLKVLNFPDNQEEKFRKILERQKPKILKNLATQSKQDIITFLIKAQKETTAYEESDMVAVEKEESKKWKSIDKKIAKEDNFTNQEEKRINQKLTKIKALFPSDILANHPDIGTKLNSLDSITDPTQKDKILKEILHTLKNPSKLKAITNDLGGADTNNPKYVEFKNSLIGIDWSFEKYFSDLENLGSGATLNSDEVIEWVENESWWVIDIDLKANPPVSKMSLVGSDYSFDETIDKKALEEIMSDSKEELETIKKSFGVLKEFGVSFDTLLKSIREHWWKDDFKTKLSEAIGSFSRDVFDDLDEVYEDMGIKWDNQIKEYDISSFEDINSPNELKSKVESIKEKFLKIKTTVATKQESILINYKTEIQELVKRKSESKERQLKVLKFFKECGFDLIPKEITNRIIANIKNNSLMIPWLPLSITNINLKNGNFGEKWVFIDKEQGINIHSKTNLVKFINKIISGDVNKPLDVQSIASGMSVVNREDLKHQFKKAGINSNLGWKYTTIINNLKKE